MRLPRVLERPGCNHPAVGEVQRVTGAVTQQQRLVRPPMVHPLATRKEEIITDRWWHSLLNFESIPSLSPTIHHDTLLPGG